MITVEKHLARIVLALFHPLLITSLGIVLLFLSDFYLSSISFEIKRIVWLSAFVGTCVIPALLLSSRHFFPRIDEINVRLYTALIYLVTAFCYYLAYYVISALPVAGFFRALFLAGALLLVMLSFITLRWNISIYTAASGALLGTALALSLRLGTSHSAVLALLILLSGLTGFACLKLGKNNPAQVYAGYILGFSVLFLIFNFIR